MIAEDVGEDRIVVIVRDEPVDLSFDFAERQLPQTHVRDELLPGINIVDDGLLVGEADHEGLGAQGRGLVAGGEPAGQQVGLKPENLVREMGQGFVDADRFTGDQETVVIPTDRGDEIAASPLQSQLRVVHVHLRLRPREGQLAACLDHLIDEKSLRAGGRVVVVRA